MKDCVVINDEAYERGSFEHLRWIWTIAQAKDPRYIRDNYKWTLGVEIFNKIKADQSIIVKCEEPITLFGVTIEVDYAYPLKIELWKNITNEL